MNLKISLISNKTINILDFIFTGVKVAKYCFYRLSNILN